MHGVYFCSIDFREGVRNGDVEECDEGGEGEACMSDTRAVRLRASTTMRNGTPTEIDIRHISSFIEGKEVGKEGSEPLDINSDADA